MKWRFGECAFDDVSGQLWRNEQSTQVPSTASEVLRVLLEQRPELVTKEELLRRVWRGTSVDEGNLSVQVTKLRDLLGDDTRAPRFIRTYFGQGYAFIGSVAADAAPDPAPSGDPIGFILEWRTRTFALTPGENIVGRNPLRCGICIDDPRVSNRHARIVVDGQSATIEDLASTNHTFVGEAQVTTPYALTNGDVIRLGGPTVIIRLTGTPTVRSKPSRHRGDARRGSLASR